MKPKLSPAIKQLFIKKWVIILILGLILTGFARVLETKSLSQSGIVIGIGLDYNDGKFTVSTQSISVSGSAAESQAPHKYVNSTATAATVMEAFDEISRKLGLIISLSHCNLIVMSPSVLKLDHLQLFLTLEKSMGLPEQALVISTPEEPGKLLAQPIATEDTAVLLTESTLVQNLGSDGLAQVTVKDFLVNSLSRSGAVRVPYARIVKPEEQPISAAPSKTEFVELKMTENLIIKGDRSFVLSSEMSEALNLYLIKKTEDKLEVILSTGERIVFGIIDKSDKTKVDGMDVEYSSKLTVSFIEGLFANEEMPLNCDSDIVKKAAGVLEKKLEEKLMDCFVLSKTKNMDFLLLENKVYQKAGRSLDPDCFQDISFRATYKLKIQENG